MEKNRFKGINTSAELVLLDIHGLEDFWVSVSLFCQALKNNKINTPFLSTTFSHNGRTSVSCCFTKKDSKRVKELIQENKGLRANASFTHGVGLLSVFPHRSSLDILGLSLSAFERANISLLGMASSISSLIFVLKYNQLGKAVDSLKGCYFLPESVH